MHNIHSYNHNTTDNALSAVTIFIQQHIQILCATLYMNVCIYTHVTINTINLV